MPHDHQTEAMLAAERRAGHEIESKENLEVRLGILRALLGRKRDYLTMHVREIDQALGEPLPPSD